MDKNKTINSQLGVADERADMLGALFTAHMFLAMKAQKESPDYKEGFDLCKGVESVIKEEVTSIAEGYVIGSVSQQFSDKLDAHGSAAFLNSVQSVYREGDTAKSLADSVYAAMLENEDRESDSLEEALRKLMQQ